MVNHLLAFGLVGRDEVLVDRKEEQIQAKRECHPLQVIDVLRCFVLHLAVKNLDSVETELGGVLDDFLNRIFHFVEMPIRVCRNADANALR